jgi:hypothetical protein
VKRKDVDQGLFIATESSIVTYMEKYFNVMNIFQDKRICFGDEQYKFRSDLTVCHWNENVDRGYTSIWKSSNPNAPAT